MCSVCGCGEAEVLVEEDGPQSHKHHHHHDGDHHHHHDGSHHHHHDGSHHHHHDGSHHHHHDGHHHIDLGSGAAGLHVPGMSQARLIELEQDIMGKNQAYADANRLLFRQNGQLALNLVSSPGSGKTTLLCKTLELLDRQTLNLGVIEGDQQTANDARRIRDTGVPAIQINTGKGCHLDGHMVGHALENLSLPQNGIVFIENVGNLVCPAAFDLGEDFRVAILSVTEGEDKPSKYPNIFASADIVIINKMDLLPHLDFDLDNCQQHLAAVAPKARTFLLSAKTGEGMPAWQNWIEQETRLKAI